jgi:hypothetical protein
MSDPARLAIAVVLAAYSEACGVAAAPPGDAAVDRASDARPFDGEAGAFTNPFCASPTACTDDPDAGVIAGTCDLSGKDWPPCDCIAGDSNNPRTGRCRAGTACVAAAADPWEFMTTFDTSDCASRAPTACTTDDPLGPPIMRLVTLACELPLELTVRVELQDGCPTRFEVAPAIGVPSFPAVAQPFFVCFSTILAQARLACSTSADCELETIFAVLTP